MRFDELPVDAWFTFDDDTPIGNEPVSVYQKRLRGYIHVAWNEDRQTASPVRRDAEVTACERRG